MELGNDLSAYQIFFFSVDQKQYGTEKLGLQIAESFSVLITAVVEMVRRGSWRKLTFSLLVSLVKVHWESKR